MDLTRHLLATPLALTLILISGCDSRMAEYRKRVGPWNGSDSTILESGIISGCTDRGPFSGKQNLRIAIIRDRGLDIDPQEADILIRALTRDFLGLGYQVVYRDTADWICDLRIQAKSGPPPKLDFGYEIEAWMIDTHDGSKSFAITTEVRKRRE